MLPSSNPQNAIRNVRDCSQDPSSDLEVIGCVSTAPPTPPPVIWVPVGPPSGGGGVTVMTGLHGPACTAQPGMTPDQVAAVRKQAAGNAYASLSQGDPVLAQPAPPSGTNTTEYYGFVFTDGTSYMYDGPYTLQTNSQTGVSESYPVPPSYNGFVAVGIWHTHPSYVNTGTTDGVESGSHFSYSDQQYSNSTGLTMYVGEENIEPMAAFRWYSREPNSTSDSNSQLFGAGHC
jgi:hypothetical protein